MKGVVFTEFLEMVEDSFGWEIADEIVDESDLESGGVYTAVGTYPHTEMVQMVVKLSEKTGMAIPDLLKAYGKHLFGRFREGYGVFFENVSSTFEFLSGIENYIHVEVRKLYPEAELPTFEYETPTENQLVLIYRSERPFADFAEGLIQGCIENFNEQIDIDRIDSAEKPGCEATFTLTKVSESEVNAGTAEMSAAD